MTNKARNYKVSDIKKLFAFSGNQCAEPNCMRPVISEDGSVVLGEICHIAAASVEGPRYDDSMSDQERRSYQNLLLLCDEHHKIIDNEITKINYPTRLLQDWKRKHALKNANSKEHVTDEIVNKAIQNVVKNNSGIVNQIQSSGPYSSVTIINNAKEKSTNILKFDLSQKVIKSISTYLNYFITFLKYPSTFYSRVKVSSFDAAVFSVFSIVLISFFDFPIYESTSAMVRGEDQLWNIILETKEERDFYTTKAYRLGSIEFFRELFSFTFWLISFYIMIRFFCPIFMAKQKFTKLFWNISVPFAVYGICASFLFFLIFFASKSELISNSFFTIFIVFFYLLNIVLFVFFVIVIRNYINTKFVKTALLILSNALIATLITGFFNPVNIYNSFSNSDSNIESAGDFNILAEEALENGFYEHAIIHSLDALKYSPENLRSDMTIIQAKKAIFIYKYLELIDMDGESANWDGQLEAYNELKNTILEFAKKYSKIPSAQLYAAQMFGDLNICDEVLRLSISVYNNDNSNPSEKVEAASILMNITKLNSINDKYHEFTNSTVWLGDYDSLLDRIGLILRVGIQRSTDNLNLLLQGQRFDDVNETIMPVAHEYQSSYDYFVVPYSCNNDMNVETILQELKEVDFEIINE